MNLLRYAFVSGALFFLLPVLSSAQVADFQADVLSGCPPSLVVNFTDQSTAGATSWNWNFGNGNTSTLQNPTAIYTQPGSYNVSLSVNGGTAKIKNAYITVYAKPVVDFNPGTTSGCAPLNVNFTNSSTAGSGTISSYSWVFGDGGTSSDTSPSHSYISPSVYSVTLTVTNQYNCSTSLVKNSLIDTKGPLVNFSSPQTSFCLTPANVTFNNSTTGQAPISYQWNFGDQTATNTQANATHSYLSAGSYDVTLTATDVNGCSATNKKNGFISVGHEPGVDFSLSADKVCVGQNITITNQTTVPVTSHLWDLGNGSQSSDLNTSVTFTHAGFFDITLKAFLPSGCEVSVVKKVEVVFDAVPDFAAIAACNRKITFVNNSQFAFSFAWNFGDGTTSFESSPEHTYASAGTYKVKLTGYNGLSCPVTIEKDITVNSNPVARILPDKANSCTELSLAGCAPFTIQFTNNTISTLALKSTLWTFGDNTNSSLSSPAHTYTAAGTYNVMLVVTNLLNCRDTARAVVRVSSTKPTANFAVDKTEVCVKEPVKFTNQSSASSDFWCWDFGDGSGSNDKNPEHAYTEPGIYTVKLTAKNGGCGDVIIKTQLIKVKNPYLDFTVMKNCATPYTITLINNSKDFNEFAWDLGDGATNTTVSNNLVHSFPSTGPYTVKLTIKSQVTGCTVTDSKPVIIQDIRSDFMPAANPVCKNNPVTFTDQSEFAVAWIWDFKDGTSSTQSSPVKAFTTPGDYNVSLRVTDTDNCSDTKIIPIKVANIQGAFSFTAVSTCDELTVNFRDASQASPSIQNWLWDFGDNTTSSDQHPVHIYNQLKSYPVRLTLQNTEATCSVLATDAVVFTNPAPDFSALKTSICVNEPITFLNKSILAQTFLWDFGNSQTSTNPTPTMVYNAPGKYTVTLKATDVYGCEKSIVKTNYLEVLQPVAQFEAFQTSAECPPLITTFKDKSSSDVTRWSWTFGDGQSSVLQNPTNTYQIPGIYDVTLDVVNFAGCAAKYKVDGLISLGGPYGDFDITSQHTCVNDAISFVATATNTVKYIWDFGDGTVLDTDKNETSHTYTHVAPANLSLTLVDSKGCRVVVGKGKKVDVRGQPEVDFDYDPEYPFEKETVVFTAALQEQLDLVWRFDEESVPGSGTIEKAFDNYGVHHVMLTGHNGDGCTGTIEKEILVQGDLKMIPNVFTPNEADPLNPTFRVEDIEKGFWELRVYNRWGQQVYHGQDYINDWDGKELSSGVYYYHITNRYRKSKAYKGYIQIVR